MTRLVYFVIIKIYFYYFGGNMADNLHEECGIFGSYDKSQLGSIASTVYYGLFALQHRGQEAAGIAINHNRDIKLIKGLGLVSDVFKDIQLADYPGEIAVGHVRYGANPFSGVEYAQPITVNYAKGNITVAYNGNISNGKALRERLENQGAIFHSRNDSETVCYMLAHERLNSKNMEEAVAKVVPKLKGAFSMIIMCPTKLIAVRDKLGVRPLCMGKIKDSIIFASETCALETVGAKFERDIEPGEICIVTRDG